MPRRPEHEAPPTDPRAARAFAAILAAAFVTIMYRNRDQWFFLDDFDFLAARDGGSLHDLFRPHNEHWSLLPILVYRGLYRLVGLRHYWPYQVVVVGLHLTAAVLLRAIMRRAGVSPWVATAAATLFALLGSGRSNIAWSFQIGFTGSLTFGLAHLLLADHEGEADRRDGLGLACGLAALLCSGVGVTMVLIVGAAVLVRRGWRTAFLHTAPLGAAFGVWFLAIGHDSVVNARPEPGAVVAFARSMIAFTFGRLGQVPGGGWFLAALLVGGSAVLVTRVPVGELRSRFAACAGLLVGAAAFTLITAEGRAGLANGAGDPHASRYVHLLGAMVLPALAVATAELVSRVRAPALVAAVVFLVPLPGNIDQLQAHGLDRFTLGSPTLTVAMAESPVVREVPADAVPNLGQTHDITAGCLPEAEAEGRLPTVNLTPQLRADATLRLQLEQRSIQRRHRCRRIDPGRVITLRVGDEILLPPGTTAVDGVVAAGPVPAARYTNDLDLGRVLAVVHGPIPATVVVSDGAGATARLCR